MTAWLNALGLSASAVGAIVTIVGAVAAGLGFVRRRRRLSRAWWEQLRPVMLRERDADIAHPYRFAFDSVPPLSAVYVARRVTARSGTRPEIDTAALLTGAGHVVLVGDCGTGKTALIRHAVAGCANRWLAANGRPGHLGPGPVVVRLAAADLLAHPVPEALTLAYRPAEAGPDAAPEPDFGQPPAPGRQWLVCVDALDAIADTDDRSVVLGRLAHHAADPTQPSRLLVATRPLAGPELAVLRRDFAVFDLATMDDAAFAAFAARWCTERGADAAAFDAWIEAAHIEAVVRNPLTATVAMLLWANGSPTDRAGLLDRFVGQLIAAGRAGMAAAYAPLRQLPPLGGQLADWLDARHPELVEVAAEGWLRRGDPVPAVLDWAATQAPTPPGTLLDDWPARARRALLASGLYAAAAAPTPTRLAAPGPGTLRPVWPALSEYLAAGPLARAWDERRWLDLMAATSRRGVGAHALARALTGTPASLAAIVADPPGALAAGHALAAGAVSDPAARDEILAALLRHWSARADDAAILAVLHRLAAEGHRDALHDLADDPGRATVVRQAVPRLLAMCRGAT